MHKNIKIKKHFANKKILITGGTGSIGSEIVRQLLKFKPMQIRIYSRDESKHFFLQKEIEEINSKKTDVKFLIGDIRDKERLNKAFRNVDIVFHTAALKHVPFCEYNPFEAIKTNVYGTQNVIDLAIEHNVEKVIAISTDKAVYPNGIMGITKLLMERMITSSYHYIGPAKTKFTVVRFGNVLNSRGSVVPTWIEQIKKGNSVTVTDKRMKRFFMSISEAVELVFLAASMMKGQEIFVLKMKEQNIYELAQKTIDKYSNGKKIKIKIIGARENEKITEELYTKEEESLMIKLNKYYVIFPNKNLFKERMKQYKNE
jgi:FlaA1/EpsC-like NDP-sugar epimerase